MPCELKRVWGAPYNQKPNPQSHPSSSDKILSKRALVFRGWNPNLWFVNFTDSNMHSRKRSHIPPFGKEKIIFKSAGWMHCFAVKIFSLWRRGYSKGKRTSRPEREVSWLLKCGSLNQWDHTIEAQTWSFPTKWNTSVFQMKHTFNLNCGPFLDMIWLCLFHWLNKTLGGLSFWGSFKWNVSEH